MEVEHKAHTILIKDSQGDLVSFLMKVTHEYKTFKEHNIIIDLSFYKEITVDDINSFLRLSKIHTKNKKSFVIVAKNLDFDSISSKLVVVPTTLEAHDIIEMEEIERDLGF